MSDQRMHAEFQRDGAGLPDEAREELHWRRVDMRAFRRKDGLYEVEGRLTDRKPHHFEPWSGGGRSVPAHEPIHDMGVRILFDENLLVLDITTFSDAYPYDICKFGGEALKRLEGLRMTGGWGKEVRERVGAERSCTHLRELLVPLATVAYQALGQVYRDRPLRLDAAGRPVKINSCFAYGDTGTLVQRLWPQFHRQEPGGSD